MKVVTVNFLSLLLVTDFSALGCIYLYTCMCAFVNTTNNFSVILKYQKASPRFLSQRLFHCIISAFYNPSPQCQHLKGIHIIHSVSLSPEPGFGSNGSSVQYLKRLQLKWWAMLGYYMIWASSSSKFPWLLVDLIFLQQAGLPTETIL